VDTTIAGISDNVLNFDGRSALRYDTEYTWDVMATDGTDSTGSTGGIIFRTPVKSDIGPAGRPPDRFSLGQNYPNPFNDSTEIPFVIEKRAQIDLAVYNVKGEKISSLRHGFYHPGRYRVVFNASRLPSGIYIYRLIAGDLRLERKCLCIK
jgi:hypothetical protein